MVTGVRELSREQLHKHFPYNLIRSSSETFHKAVRHGTSSFKTSTTMLASERIHYILLAAASDCNMDFIGDPDPSGRYSWQDELSICLEYKLIT